MDQEAAIFTASYPPLTPPGQDCSDAISPLVEALIEAADNAVHVRRKNLTDPKKRFQRDGSPGLDLLPVSR